MIKFSNQENIDQIQILYLKGGPWLFDFHCCCFPENYKFCKTNICLISYRIGHAIYVITTSYYKSETLKCDSFENHVFNIEKGVLKCVFSMIIIYEWIQNWIIIMNENINMSCCERVANVINTIDQTQYIQ